MHQEFSRRTWSQWTPVSKRYIAWCVFCFLRYLLSESRVHMYMSELKFCGTLDLFYVDVTCHLQWSVYWERSLHQVVLLKVWGRPPAPLVGGGSTMKRSTKVIISLIIRCLLELQQKSLSQYDFSLFHLRLDEIGGEAEEVWCFTGYGETTCAS